MEKANMQLTVFSKEGIMYTALPPADDQKSSYWRVCGVCAGEILQIDERVVDDPASGDMFTVRVLTARDLESEESQKPTPEVIITKHGDTFPNGDTFPVRKYLEALAPGHPEFTLPLEYKFFMPYGSYKIETKDESWIMRTPTDRNPQSNLPYDKLFFDRRTCNSVGLCMASPEDLDAKSILVTLSWADQPKDLDLCIGHADGVVKSNSAVETKPANAPKGISVITSHLESGFGPKTISVMQPISAKLKVYVMDRSSPKDPKTFIKSFPMVNILFYNQIWRSFTLKIPDSPEAALEAKSQAGSQCCWHVCDLKIEQDTKMGENCVECTETNVLLDAEIKMEPS